MIRYPTLAPILSHGREQVSPPSPSPPPVNTQIQQLKLKIAWEHYQYGSLVDPSYSANLVSNNNHGSYDYMVEVGYLH